MNIKLFLKVLLKRIWLVILMPVMMAGLTFSICNFFISPVYESTQTFYVINKGYNTSEPAGYDQVMVDQQLLRDYREIIKSKYITGAVIERLRLNNIGPEDLSKRVNVVLINETRIMAIKVKDNDPVMAQRLTECYGEVFLEQARAWMNIESINIIDRADFPRYPVIPNTMLFTLVTAILGLFAAISIIFFMEYWDDTIKTVDDIEVHLGISVLGTIPYYRTR